MIASGLKQWPVYGSALISGAVLMILEIDGSLMLAPHFGSTVFVWGSIISIFMLGLSLGYLLGGRAASRGWSLKSLAGLLLAAALWVFLSGKLGTIIPDLLGPFYNLPYMAALMPMAASAILFLFPSLIIGMITPLAVAASVREPASVGTEAGRISAWSTVGGLAGALVATFIFPIFAGQTIVRYGCGSLLALTALFLSITPVNPIVIIHTETKTQRCPVRSLHGSLRI